MAKNEELLQKLRDFRQEKMIELKNENPDKQVDIEDIIYCGELNFEENGKEVEKQVFLVIKNIDGKISMVYSIDNDEIAVQMDIAKMIDEDGIIPTLKYKDRNKDFEKLKENEDKRVSLNELEIENITHMAKALGIEEKQIDASSEVDANKLNEVLVKSLDIKSEFNPNQKVTGSESFSNLIPGSGKYSKIAVVYSKNTNDRFKMVGITSNGKVEEIPGLVQTEGVNPTEEIVTADRYGDKVKSTTAQALYKIKGRPNEGFSMNIGQARMYRNKLCKKRDR